jgi:FixJ family two-component response regulator
MHARYETLTVRERDVFGRVAQGQLNRQIAADLHIAERTVKAHRARVMQKMQTNSLANLARIAERLGI